jgi:FAD/FMN-containing dehydrogenase
VGDGLLLDQLDEATLQSLVAAVGPGAETHLLMAELRQLGGALRRVPEGAGALGALQADYVAYFVAIAPTPEIGAIGLADTARAVAAVAGAATGRRYLNFSEVPVDCSTGFDATGWARLQQVKAEVDPDRVFLANHSFTG